MPRKYPDYEIIPFPKVRLRITDSLGFQYRKNIIHSLTEVDVSKPRQYIHEHRSITGEVLSFTAFIATCIAKAVDENKCMHAYRKGKKQLVLFDDVDITTLIEHEVGGDKIATPYIIRAANTKTFVEIHKELRAAQEQKAHKFRVMPWYERIYFSLPAFSRVLFLWALGKSPRTKKKLQGTVALVAVGMFGKEIGWVIPMTKYTLCITLGGISTLPGILDGRLVNLEHLSMTISVDHEIIDGAPLARFTSRLKELVTTGYGLLE